MLVALSTTSLTVAPLEVAVEESAYADEVAAGLSEELTREVRVVRDAKGATLKVRAVREKEVLAVSVRTVDGETLLTRRIPLDPEDPRAALRVANLLCAQTVRVYLARETQRASKATVPSSASDRPVGETSSSADPPTNTGTARGTGSTTRDDPQTAPADATAAQDDRPPLVTEPSLRTSSTGPSRTSSTGTATTSRPRWLVVPVGLTVGGWLRPATPLVGFFGGVGVRFGRLTTIVRAEVAGLLCCRLSDDRFDGNALEVAVLAETRYRLVRLGGFELLAAAAAGAAHVRVEGRPDDDPSFPVRLAEQTRSTWDPQARLALGLSWPVWRERLSLSLWGGVQVRADRLRVDLPARDGDPLPLDAGPVMPWFGLAASFLIL